MLFGMRFVEVKFVFFRGNENSSHEQFQNVPKALSPLIKAVDA